ncbi:hypothetical protein [Falsihalocynthiibacter sp. CO-5D18]|uniref:hypothetical protein n=1 Tax=Falsihalocynthiibacter sp. CO-5D18 TaxID=3240872 RepID=UPI00350F8C92
MIDALTIRTCIGSLQMRTDDERPSHFASWVVEQGGTWPVIPEKGNQVIVQLFGVVGTGTLIGEAICNWINAASRLADTEERVEKARAALRGPTDIDGKTVHAHCETLKSFGTPEDFALAVTLATRFLAKPPNGQAA